MAINTIRETQYPSTEEINTVYNNIQKLKSNSSSNTNNENKVEDEDAIAAKFLTYVDPGTIDLLKSLEVDYGELFLNGGKNIGDLSILLAGIEQLAGTMVQDLMQDTVGVAADTVTSIAGEVTSIGTEALDLLNGLETAVGELINAALKDLVNEILGTVMNAKDEMLAIPSLSTMSSSIAEYTLTLTPLSNGIILDVLNIPASLNPTELAGKVLGKVAGAVAKEVASVNGVVMEKVNEYSEFIHNNILNQIPQGLDVVAKQIARLEQFVINELNYVLYGLSPTNTTGIEIYQDTIKELTEKKAKLETKLSKLNAKKDNDNSNSYIEKITIVKYKIDELNTKIKNKELKIAQIQEQSDKKNKRKQAKKQEYVNKINTYKDKINALNNSGKFSELIIMEKRDYLQKIINAQTKMLTLDGIVGNVNYIKLLAAQSMALEIAAVAAKKIYKVEREALHEILLDSELAKAEAVCMAESKVFKAVTKLFRMS